MTVSLSVSMEEHLRVVDLLDDRLKKAAAEIARLREAKALVTEAVDDFRDTIHAQQGEIERLRKERDDILAAKEIVFAPPAIPEGFVIQELQKANVALHADIARLRSGARCPHCDELRLDLGDARREIERLREENDALKDEVELKAAALTGTSRVMGEEIDRLRNMVYAVPPTENMPGISERMAAQTWKEACEANRDEVARLDNLLRTYRLPDEVVDIKVVIELRAEIERLRGLLRETEQELSHAPQTDRLRGIRGRVREALGDE